MWTFINVLFKRQKFLFFISLPHQEQQQQPYPKGNNTKWNRNDDDNNNVMFSLPNYRNLIQYTPLKLKKNVSWKVPLWATQWRYLGNRIFIEKYFWDRVFFQQTVIQRQTVKEGEKKKTETFLSPSIHRRTCLIPLSTHQSFFCYMGSPIIMCQT